MPFNIGSILFIACLMLAYTQAHNDNNLTQQTINLNEYKTQRNANYRYALRIDKLPKAQPKHDNQSGLLFKGPFSTFILKDRSGKQFQYQSLTFSLRWPSLHQFAQINQKLIQFQIAYQFIPQPQSTSKASYPHVIVSFLFMISEYLPEKDLLSMHQFITSVENQQQIDLKQIIRQQITGPVYVYSTKNETSSTLRIVRKQLRLIGRKQLQKMISIAGKKDTQSKENIIKPKNIYEMKSFEAKSNQTANKDDL